MTKTRSLHFIIGILFVILGFVVKVLYRPYAYSNNLIDLGFSNSSPSLFYIVGFSLLLLVNPRFRIFYTVLIVTSASILFEVYQYLNNGQIDISDIIYSLVGGILTIVICEKIITKHISI